MAGPLSTVQVALRGTSASPDGQVRSAPVSLTIAKCYELSGWVRTEGLSVRHLDRVTVSIHDF